MVRLPAFGTAVAFLAFLGASATALGDPITMGAGNLTAGGKSLFSWSAPEFSAQSASTGVNRATQTAAGERFLSLDLGFGERFGLGDVDFDRDRPPSVWVEGFLPPGVGLLRADPNGVPFRFSGTVSTPTSGGGGPVAPVSSVTMPAAPAVDVFSGSLSSNSVSSGALPAAAPAISSGLPAAAVLPGLSSGGTVSEVGNAGASFAGSASVVTPEPASLLLLGSGLALAALRSRARKQDPTAQS